MTVTFRKALHKSNLGCLIYITNPNKTDGGLLVSGINCSPDANLAHNEMLMMNVYITIKEDVLAIIFISRLITLINYLMKKHMK